MDRRALIVLYGYARKSKTFGGLMKFIYKNSAAVFFLIYYAGAMYLIFTDTTALIQYIGAPVVTILASRALRKLIKRKRPYEAIKGIQAPEDKSKSKKPSYSFPSNHGASASAIAFACLTINAGLGVLVFLLAIFTGLSRIALGAHYITDIASGFALSTAVAVLMLFIV